jgi:hypothetical protein
MRRPYSASHNDLIRSVREAFMYVWFTDVGFHLIIGPSRVGQTPNEATESRYVQISSEGVRAGAG